MTDPDVHVDWHMTPGEWQELRQVLLRHTETTSGTHSCYIVQLQAEGKLT